MSHFTVLVVGEDPENQLYPFDEQPEEGSELLKFNDIEPEYRQKYETETTRRVKTPSGELLAPWDERFRKPGEFGYGNRTHEVPPDHEEVEVPLRELFSSFDEYITEYCGYEKDDETGKFGYYHNPNAKWDWYVLGGRWTGYFKLKEGAEGESGRPGLMTEPAKAGWVDQARKCDIDFEGMMSEWAKEAEDRWNQGMMEPDSREKYWKYGIRDTDTRESFIRRNSSLATFALLKDGKWYEKGQMGWWGMVADEKDQEKWEEEFAKMLAGLPDETLLSVYDCHI